MNDYNNICHCRHCVFKMHVHLVFVTKYRRTVFDSDAIERLRKVFGYTGSAGALSIPALNGEAFRAIW